LDPETVPADVDYLSPKMISTDNPKYGALWTSPLLKDTQNIT
jgi:hypothetical protein